jgi:hypothetical protein
VKAARLGFCAVLVSLSACAQQQPLYHWGSYEALLYKSYREPGSADPGMQIAKLTEDVERAHAESRNVPPGVHAHLGYLYYTQGQPHLAREEFLIEKQLFPESTTFIDGMLNRMDKR